MWKGVYLSSGISCGILCWLYENVTPSWCSRTLFLSILSPFCCSWPSTGKNSLLEFESQKFRIYGTSQIPMVCLFVSSSPQEGGEERDEEWKRGMWSHRWPQHVLLLLLWAKTLEQPYSCFGEGHKSTRNCPSHPQKSLYLKTPISLFLALIVDIKMGTWIQGDQTPHLMSGST